ncbi:MAG: MFS transporter [Succinivibrio sp.]
MHFKNNKLNRACIAGKLCFFLSGMGIAPWASIMPFVKERLGLNELVYAFTILTFGVGAVVGMPLTGFLVRKFGIKKILFFAFLGLYLSVITVSISSISLYPLLATVFIWGASLGTAEVASNVHGSYFEEITDKHLLSGFHAFETMGTLVAALCYPLLLWLNFSLFSVSLITSIPCLVSLFFIEHSLIDTNGQKSKATGTVKSQSASKLIILAGTACFFMYLCEGMVYDWSGVYLHDNCKVSLESASLGYLSFQIAVSIARFFGDRAVSRFREIPMLTAGSAIAFICLLVIAWHNNPAVVIAGLAILGIALGNVVPIVFSYVAKKCEKDKAKAISMTGTIGYSGVLTGPAVLGLAASFWSLSAIFELTACFMIIMGIICFVLFTAKRQ